jgi:hypothetical protein
MNMRQTTTGGLVAMGAVAVALFLGSAGSVQAAPVPDSSVHLTFTVPGPAPVGTFDTEMLSMNLVGGPLMIRESPSKASLGKTTITGSGGGPYMIDSFFDVFTELSLGGATPPLVDIPTEMLQLDIRGPQLMIRESPTLPSLGKTTIMDDGSGQYRIGSFFDVFVELSLDGGQTWLPSSGQGRFALTSVPLPDAVWGGGLVLAGVVLKKRLVGSTRMS